MMTLLIQAAEGILLFQQEAWADIGCSTGMGTVAEMPDL